MSQAIRYEAGADGIVLLTLDMPGQSANTMNATYRAAMAETLERLEAEREQIAGVILTSAKKTFFAGGDLNELVAVTRADAEPFFRMVQLLKQQLRRLETLGKPVVAAINGSALGGGWEICLACQHRIALDAPDVQLGLPEVTLGLLPGGGGIVRTVRLLGIEKALPFLLEGKKLRPREALKAGLLHEVVGSREALLSQARTWILANPEATQPWDAKGYKLPGGTPSHPGVAQMLAIAPAMLQDKTKGCFPAPEKILCAAVEGAQVDFATAELIETRYFTELATGQVAKNMIGAFWFQLNEINAGRSRPSAPERRQVGKVGVLGAGMMGAGIAYVSAAAGVEVVLKDVSVEAAEKGKAYSAGLLDKKLSRGHLTADEREAFLARIRTTNDEADFAGCDLVIEAVFENRELKGRVTAAAEAAALPDAVIASNTSTLPITGLARAVQHPERFVGLHFFSPVDKMPLVEIIRGEQTSDETLARAFDFVQQIRKTPIVVNDSRGFFTSRVFGTYTNEGLAMLGEGVSAAMIENQARQAGMPVGPLAVSDEVSLSLMAHIRAQTRADLAEEGKSIPEHPAFVVIDAMLERHQRPGKAAGGGFYDYPAGGRKQLWPGLKEAFAESAQQPQAQEVRDRLLFIQAIETVRCLEEGVLTSVADANIGSVFGIGFAAWSGGALQFINQYGVARFVARARELAERHGERFAPPSLLLDKAATGGQF
ncbi:3-hydroxyacyl-CoA dehydrogenase NAD-binding domain-containing protein [Pseudomonas flexibilis]|uniref:3-hydroxyacyl-CoA dehydrogenase n=1 Tax=Pseudomonas flexibilis TaxID=706570 RepID=A0A0B3BMQ2_9PSED|nr:3-hydroxyacyl-CoA dehydrogenase NAD-binding domain-containing protein [Pseudomonas flexibilis]KHO65733.1 3-hydroxyacyl-CoA dehydrogenase [Pseudomonas flexibilis]SCX77556.1 3-hydroxyacyl-CoA dehydrogenase / enoyl-CoA hydratase / 3-hydroxybutyryl-CoA epimerase [Pseudomonas flexibilis]